MYSKAIRNICYNDSDIPIIDSFLGEFKKYIYYTIRADISNLSSCNRPPSKSSAGKYYEDNPEIKRNPFIETMFNKINKVFFPRFQPVKKHYDEICKCGFKKVNSEDEQLLDKYESFLTQDQAELCEILDVFRKQNSQNKFCLLFPDWFPVEKKEIGVKLGNEVKSDIYLIHPMIGIDIEWSAWIEGGEYIIKPFVSYIWTR
ncbi:hypothetical protein Hokovirus_2_193 [Hokovirus HKV1]|uniref:Uncharacterized protein n=1 Tax=Hokovirus HKV1 TaxID=1977638 RepID=A0A1V0SG10_9VIRU|nr:hypothetical protein Hokovirus_2_193 [Hokovirus HKV1]